MKTDPTFALIPSQFRLFEDQDFEQRAPGTILRDFEALLGLIGDEGMPVTPAHLFALKCLEPINRSLTHPLELGMKRAIQKSYPHINGLYLLLRATGLAVIAARVKNPRLELDSQLMESWRCLNAAERYFALLKAWWGRASEEVIGEHGHLSGEILLKTIRFWESFPKRGTLTVRTPQDLDMLRYRPSLYNLALLELFGLLEIRVESSAESRGWRPESIRMTDWGAALLGSYVDFLQQSSASKGDSTSPMLNVTALLQPLECFESWSRIVRPHIKRWHNNLDILESPFQPGPHLFKVSLGTGCWRRISIGGDYSLDALAATILDAFDFDSDHLYCFNYKDRFGRSIEVGHPSLAGDLDNTPTNEIGVGDLSLYQGMRIGFLYDFGDEWNFDIYTESTNIESTVEEPQLLEKYGEAPEQYGD